MEYEEEKPEVVESLDWFTETILRRADRLAARRTRPTLAGTEGLNGLWLATVARGTNLPLILHPLARETPKIDDDVAENCVVSAIEFPTPGSEEDDEYYVGLRELVERSAREMRTYALYRLATPETLELWMRNAAVAARARDGIYVVASGRPWRSAFEYRNVTNDVCMNAVCTAHLLAMPIESSRVYVFYASKRKWVRVFRVERNGDAETDADAERGDDVSREGELDFYLLGDTPRPEAGDRFALFASKELRNDEEEDAAAVAMSECMEELRNDPSA